MIHVYLDDFRPCPEGFTLARSAEECLLLLEECEVDILSLDHDLGWGQPTGTDVVKQMVHKRLFANRIYLHTSDSAGRRRMYELLHQSRPGDVGLHDGPMPPDLLLAVAREQS